jgi:hypothetical protein
MNIAGGWRCFNRNDKQGADCCEIRRILGRIQALAALHDT